MNIAFDPWIPVLTKDGQRQFVSLCDVFESGETLRDLSVFPHERVALMRLFTAVAHAALQGPIDEDDWIEIPNKLATSARHYLEKWKGSFNLHDAEKPWLQIVGLTKEATGKANGYDGWTPVSKLVFQLASGNNSTLFDHAADCGAERVLTEEALPLAMLTYQCFSPGGLIGQTYWGGKQTDKSSKDAPCSPSSMFHAFVRDTSLLQTIIRNLPTYETIKQRYGSRDIGHPVWEMMPKSFDDEAAIKNATQTYLGRLVPIKRLMLLADDEPYVLMGDGPAYPGLFDGFPAEPSATEIATKDKRTPLSFRPSKGIWRELGAIMVRRNVEGIGGPLCLSMCGQTDAVDLVVTALARDKASIIDTTESVFRISPTIRSERGAQTYKSEVAHAETVFSRLSWALETYRQEIDGGWNARLKMAGPSKGELKAKLTTVASGSYWTFVESHLSCLFSMIEKLGTDAFGPANEAWRTLLLDAAKNAYSTACGQTTPRQIKAYAQGWKKLIIPIDAKLEMPPLADDEINDEQAEEEEA